MITGCQTLLWDLSLNQLIGRGVGEGKVFLDGSRIPVLSFR